MVLGNEDILEAGWWWGWGRRGLSDYETVLKKTLNETCMPLGGYKVRVCTSDMLTEGWPPSDHISYWCTAYKFIVACLSFSCSRVLVNFVVNWRVEEMRFWSRYAYISICRTVQSLTSVCNDCRMYCKKGSSCLGL